MKKLLTIAACMALAASAFSQGTITFANTSGTVIQTNNFVNPAGLMTAAQGALYTYELQVGPNLSVNNGDAGWNTIATTAGSGIAGRFGAGTKTNTFVGPGGTFAVHVRAFLTAGGSFANASWRGESGYANVTGGNPTTTPPGVAAAIFGGSGLTGFQVSPVPEPSSIALGLLGLGAIALFRRRK